MGIDGIEQLKGNVEEDYHVVIVGRTGEHRGTGLYVVGPGSRRNAIFTGEKAYQNQFKVATNIALRSHIAHSGSEFSCREFVLKMEEKMKENLGATGET